MKIVDSYPNFILKLIKTLNKNKVEYMIIGGVSCILQGFNHTTQDVDIYPENSTENNKKLLKVLKVLKFKLSSLDEVKILQGYDFIQFNFPQELDIVFAPDGFENYNEAKKYKVYKNDIPLLSLQGIIKSKKEANRAKDKLILPFLVDFLKFKKEGFLCTNENPYDVPKGYKVTDIQTLKRWILNEKRSIVDKLKKGILTI